MSKKIKQSYVASEPKQMTLTVVDSNEIFIFFAETGIATIDWGNGSECKINMLKLKYRVNGIAMRY